MAKFRFLDLEDDEFQENADASETSEFAALLAEDQGQGTDRGSVRVSEKIQAPVVQIGRESVFLDLGGKLTGVASLDEWADDTVPQVGQVIDLFVKSVNGSEVILTRVMKTDAADPQQWIHAKESGAPVEGKVEKAVNGGFQVKAGQTRAFVPISHMDTQSITDPEVYVGKTFSFQVLEVKEGGRNVIFSRRNLLRQEEEEQRNALLRDLTEGETRTATITKLMPFGAFARLGPGVEGLIGLSELAWKHVTKAADVVKEGEEVQVKILSITHSPKLRLSLSLKDAGTDPWLVLATRLTPGQQVKGTVSRVVDFGAFIATDAEVEGLVHISELSWTKRIRHPGDVLRPGEEHTFTVLQVDSQNRRLSLSFRGPMPEEMQARMRSAQQGGAELTPEEQEMMENWKAYDAARTTQSAQNQRPAQGALAAAFQQARRRT
jgi:small subunit ribosomal protein S1